MIKFMGYISSLILIFAAKFAGKILAKVCFKFQFLKLSFKNKFYA
jgi:hypothetical protein